MLPSGRWRDLPTLLAGADDRNADPSALYCSGGPAALWRPPTEHGFWRTPRPRCGAAAPKRPEALNARRGLMPRPGRVGAREGRRHEDVRGSSRCLCGAADCRKCRRMPPRRQATLPPDAGQSAGRRITHPCLVPAGWLHGQLPVIRFPMTLSGAQFGIALPRRAQFCIVRLRVSLWSAIRCL